MQKLVVVVMGQDCEGWIDICLNSVKDADAIVYCDGGSNNIQPNDGDGSLINILFNNYDFDFPKKGYAKEKSKLDRHIIERQFDKSDRGNNGKQRNFYLDYVKKNYPGWWCLALDVDECMDDDGINKIKEFIQTAKDGAYSVHMRHLIDAMLLEDATREEHLVPHRLFKIIDDLEYPEVEHPALYCKSWKENERAEYVTGWYKGTTIWHLAGVLPLALMYKERYENNIKNSNIHNKEFLDWWYMSHIFGTYPKKQLKPEELPRALLEKFKFEKDQFYFMERNIDAKHFIMTSQWTNWIKEKYKMDYDYKPYFIEFGCGKAPYGYALKSYGCDYDGIELSKFAVEHSFVPIKQGNITTRSMGRQYDCVLALDVFEHLDDTQLNQAMINLLQHGDLFIFSVPVKGDPNLEKDKSHKQFRTRREWEDFWKSYGLTITIPPEGWLFREQLFIGERK